MTFSRGLAVIASAALLGAGPAIAEERPEVQDLANRWTASYNEADAKALAAMYASDAELYVHNDGRYVGKEAIEAYWLSDMDISNPITVLTVTDSVSDTEMILVHGNYQVLDRKTGVPLGMGRFAHIWVLEDEGWVLDRDVWMDQQR